MLIGEALFQNRDFEKADDHFVQALGFNPGMGRALLGQARVAVVQKHSGEAERLVEKALAKDGKNVRAWLTKADIERAQGKNEAAIAAFEKAASQVRSKQDYFYHVAMRNVVSEYLKANNPEKAQAVLNELKQAYYKQEFPDDIELNHARAVLAFEQKNYDQAGDLDSKVLKADSSHLGAILLLGAIDAIQGKDEQAESRLKQFLAFVPGHVQARKLLASVQVRQRRPDEAVETLAPVVKNLEKPDSVTLSLIAQASIQSGNAAKGTTYYQRALQQNPDEANLRIGLAQSYVAQDEFDKAISELQKIDQSKETEGHVGLAMVETYIKAKNYSAALDKLKEIESKDAKSPLLVSLQGTVYQLEGNEAKAVEQFKRAMTIEPGYAPAVRSLAQMEVRASKYDNAAQYYDAALKANPHDYNVMYDYASMEIKRGQVNEAEKWLKKARDEDKNKARNTVLLARLYLRQGRASEALSELRALADNSDPAVYAEQGNAQMMLGEYHNALDSYEKLAKLQHKSALADYLVYTAHVALGDKENARQALDRSLKVDPQFVPAMVANAEMMISDKQITAASEWIDKLEKIMPGSDSITSLKAQLAMLKNNPNKAIDLYLGMYKKNPSPQVVQRLVQAYWMQGEKSEALNVLNEAAENNPENSQLQYVLGTAYHLIGEKDKAIKSYKKAVKLNDQHVLALNNLAWLLKDSDKQQALSYIERALDLAPENKDVQDTYEKIKAK